MNKNNMNYFSCFNVDSCYNDFNTIFLCVSCVCNVLFAL
jgi:hypothetical protein